MPRRKFYKVVYRHRDAEAALSAMADLHTMGITPYEKGVWAEAPEAFAELGYHLLVFDNRSAAWKFAMGQGLLFREVWTCDVEEEVELPPMYIKADDLINHEGETYWMTGFGWPEHTRMFKRVRLGRQLTVKVRPK